MVRQCCMDYRSMPDLRGLTLDQVRALYEGLVPSLIKAIKGGAGGN